MSRRPSGVQSSVKMGHRILFVAVLTNLRRWMLNNDNFNKNQIKAFFVIRDQFTV